MEGVGRVGVGVVRVVGRSFASNMYERLNRKAFWKLRRNFLGFAGNF